MPAAKLAKINLLPKDSFEFSSLGKFLKWSLTTGRVLVVLTEFVVILAFGSRFYFDKRLNDLIEEIDAKQAVVDSYAEIEKTTRDILTRQKVVDSYLTNNLRISDRINQIRRATPQDVTFDDIAIGENGLSLSGTANSESGLANLIAGINQIPDVESVTVAGIDFDQRQGNIKFKISVSITPPRHDRPLEKRKSQVDVSTAGDKGLGRNYSFGFYRGGIIVAGD